MWSKADFSFPESIKELTVELESAQQKKLGDAVYDPLRGRFRKGQTLVVRDLVKWKYQRTFTCGDYLAVIRAFDESVKRCWLPQRNGLEENTLVVYTLDQDLSRGAWLRLQAIYVQESFRYSTVDVLARSHSRCSTSGCLGIQSWCLLKTFLRDFTKKLPIRNPCRAWVSYRSWSGNNQPIGEKVSYYATSISGSTFSPKNTEGAFAWTIQDYSFLRFRGLNGNSYDLQSGPKELSNVLLSPQKMQNQSVRIAKTELKRLKEEYKVN